MLRQALAIAAIAPVVVAGSAVACSSGSHSGDAGVEAGADASTRDARPDHDSGGGRDGGPPIDAGVPYLTSLRVSSAAEPSVTLVPDFSPTTHDYYVRCPAGLNDLTVAMKASPGAESLLVQPGASAAKPSQTVTRSVAADEAVVAAATNGAQTVSYWVRCLPPDFPEFTWAPTDAGAPPPGYYLVGSFSNPPSPESPFAMVLDRNGVPVWYFRELNKTGVDNVDTVVDGAVSFIPFPKPFPYEIHELGKLTTVTLDTPALDEHELRRLPNGHFLVLANPYLGGIDLKGLKVFQAGDGGSETFGKNSAIQDCVVRELYPDGGIAWSWSASAHFDPAIAATFPTPSGEVKEPDGGEVVDTFHCNSIDVDEPSGNLLVSARNTDAIFYIERATGRVLWQIGGAAASLDPSTTHIAATAADTFYRQHDARLLPSWKSTCSGGAGEISVFDDETAKPGPSRAILYDVAIDLGAAAADCGAPAPDAGSGTVKAKWEYPGEIPSSCCGSFRILADGSRIIGWGNNAKNDRVFSEVDIGKNDLLDFSFVDRVSSYRAIKVETSALDIQAMRNSVGHP